MSSWISLAPKHLGLWGACKGGDTWSSPLLSVGHLREFNGRDEEGAIVGPPVRPVSSSSSALKRLLSEMVVQMVTGRALRASFFLVRQFLV